MKLIQRKRDREWQRQNGQTYRHVAEYLFATTPVVYKCMYVCMLFSFSFFVLSRNLPFIVVCLHLVLFITFVYVRTTFFDVTTFCLANVSFSSFPLRFMFDFRNSTSSACLQLGKISNTSTRHKYSK